VSYQNAQCLKSHAIYRVQNNAKVVKLEASIGLMRLQELLAPKTFSNSSLKYNVLDFSEDKSFSCWQPAL
jgi:hypothetical protein